MLNVSGFRFRVKKAGSASVRWSGKYRNFCPLPEERTTTRLNDSTRETTQHICVITSCSVS